MKENFKNLLCFDGIARKVAYYVYKNKRAAIKKADSLGDGGKVVIERYSTNQVYFVLKTKEPIMGTIYKVECKMTEEEKKIVQRVYHEIALLADQKAKDYREENDYSIEAAALEDFAGELWLRINDFDIEVKE